MLRNPTYKKYESSLTDLQQFGVRDINAWYEGEIEYLRTPQDIVISLASDVQGLFSHPEHHQSAQRMLNRLRWVTINKLSNR